jgi:hypothetical protein
MKKISTLSPGGNTLRYVTSTVLVLLTAASLFAGQPEPDPAPRHSGSKPAWEWTLSERLKSRLDVSEIRRRAQVHLAELSEGSDKGHIQPNTSPKDFFYIDGSKNPELFLSYELMNALLRGISSDVETREATRRGYRGRIEQFGWNASEFWATIERISAGYTALIDAQAKLQDQLFEPQTLSQRDGLLAERAALHRSICQRRAAILRSARAAFDAGEFDRFLYMAVAPYLSVSSDIPQASESAKLQQLEEGCR